MKKRHILLISTFLGSLAAMVIALPSWTEATTPAVVGSLIMNAASFIGAMSTDRATFRRRGDLGSISRRDLTGGQS